MPRFARRVRKPLLSYALSAISRSGLRRGAPFAPALPTAIIARVVSISVTSAGDFFAPANVPSAKACLEGRIYKASAHFASFAVDGLGTVAVMEWLLEV